MHEILEWIKGWLNLLSGVWGVILLPYAILSLVERKSKIIGIILIAFVMVYVVIFIHDIQAHLNNKRPWVPFYEFVFDLAIPLEERTSALATVPIGRERVLTKVRHVKRGNYSIGIMIPDKVNNFTPVEADIRLRCDFIAKNGDVLFQICSDGEFKKLWSCCMGKQGGSNEIYCKYNVPKDLPLDDELQLCITIEGEIDKFLDLYPAAILTVDKYSDK